MFVIKYSIHSNNYYANWYLNEVSKGQKVTKTGYKWKFDHCSKINLPNHRFIQFDISDAWKCQKRCCWLFWYAFLSL